MKTQQNDKTIPNKAKSKQGLDAAAATSPASILVWSFQLKSFRRAVVPTSESNSVLSYQLVENLIIGKGRVGAPSSDTYVHALRHT